ncbi:hypothetical protein [Ruegeria arenilitoris]|nr:hypothetical protein [Ruegeria arenilitoris]
MSYSGQHHFIAAPIANELASSHAICSLPKRATDTVWGQTA